MKVPNRGFVLRSMGLAGACAMFGCGPEPKPVPENPAIVSSATAPETKGAIEEGNGAGAKKDGGEEPIPAPEFAATTVWLNAKPLKLSDQNGKVVVVHFWTNGCINCIHNYPHYRAWTEKYKRQAEFLMVGIHTPEFAAEKDLERIKERATANHLTFPIAVDNDSANWIAWSNRFWPSVYLIDKAGHVRFRWEGELGDEGFQKASSQIERLLAEKPPKTP